MTTIVARGLTTIKISDSGDIYIQILAIENEVILDQLDNNVLWKHFIQQVK